MSASAKRFAIPAYLYAGCLLLLFFPGWFQSQIPAFRDAYHFYFPQAVWLDNCLRAGEVFPRWDPTTGWGASVAGQGSYATYYPLRLLWMLPGCSVAQRFAVFVVCHVALAGMGTAYAARCLRLSLPAAGLSAASYSLSCPVLFQQHNLIYLTSAAWIGFALGALVSLYQHRSLLRSSILFSLSGAMMLLGGDPHTLANTLIVAALVIAGMLVRQLRGGQGTWTEQMRKLASHVGRLAIWGTLVSLLILSATAVQWIPMLRAAGFSPRTKQINMVGESNALFAARGGLTQPDSQPTQLGLQRSGITSANGLVERLAESVDPPSHRIYDFSLSPWHLATIFWPLLGGHFLPEHARWFVLLPAEGRMWIPSLYFGWLPCLLVVSGLRCRYSSRRFYALFGLAVFAWLASMGNYTPTWLAREAAHAAGLSQLQDSLPPSRVGGVYWSLTLLVPGYQAFRYPAKWTVWFVAAASLAAAVRFDERRGRRGILPELGLILRILILGGSLVICTLGVLGWFWAASYPEAADATLRSYADAWLGSPQMQAIACSLVFSSVLPLALVAWSKLHVASRMGCLVITTVEMTCVAAFTIAFAAPPTDKIGRPQLGFDDPAVTSEPGQLVRVWSDISEADFAGDRKWLSGVSRIEQQTNYQLEFMLGKLTSALGVANAAGTQSIPATQLVQLRSRLAALDDMTSRQPELDRILATLGVTHRLVRVAGGNSGDRLIWRQVPKCRPFCELLPGRRVFQQTQNVEVPADSTPPRIPTVSKNEWPENPLGQINWRWHGSSRLIVELRGGPWQGPEPDNRLADAVKLLIRQFDDGGWRIVEYRADGSKRSLRTKPNGGFFLEIPVTSNTIRVELTREWLW